MSTKTTLSLREVAELVKQGEGTTLEFKRSTGELKGAMQTLCAFLNGSGGTVFFGVSPNGTIKGQTVRDPQRRTFAAWHYLGATRGAS